MAGTRAERKRPVNLGDFGFGQLEVSGLYIFGDVLKAGSLGNGKEFRSSHQEPERNLPNGRLVSVRDLLQHAATGSARCRKLPMTKRAVGDHGDIVPLTPGNNGMLNRTLLQMVENLIASEVTLASDLNHSLKVRHIEVADAPGRDFPGVFELLKGGDCFPQRVTTRPVEEVAIETVGSQASQ